MRRGSLPCDPRALTSPAAHGPGGRPMKRGGFIVVAHGQKLSHPIRPVRFESSQPASRPSARCAHRTGGALRGGRLPSTAAHTTFHSAPVSTTTVSGGPIPLSEAGSGSAAPGPRRISSDRALIRGTCTGYRGRRDEAARRHPRAPQVLRAAPGRELPTGTPRPGRAARGARARRPWPAPAAPARPPWPVDSSTHARAIRPRAPTG